MTVNQNIVLAKADVIMRYIESRPVEERTLEEQRFLHLRFCCNDWCDAPEWVELEEAVDSWKF